MSENKNSDTISGKINDTMSGTLGGTFIGSITGTISGTMGDVAAVRAATCYSVATLGFESPERRAIRGVLGLSEQGEPIFRPFVEAPNHNPNHNPHLLVVNADNPDALRLGMSLKHSGRHRKVTAVFVSRAAEVPAARYMIRRPILAADLIALLEQVAIEELGYVPLDGVGTEDRLIVLTTEEAVAAVVAGVATAVAAAAAAPAVTVAPALGEAPAVPATPAVTAPSTPPETPAAAMPSAAPAVPVAITTSAAVSPSSALVIDGSLPVRIRMRKVLAPVVSRVDFAGNGAQALERIESQRYSLIFLDADLPGQDAYGICRRIRNHPLQQRTPVVLLTSRSAPTDRVKGRDAGCDTYLVKPVRELVLLQVAAQLMGTTGERRSAPLMAGALAL
jgi:CheY-like chemotaxis protein